jgi:NADH:ubiquinone oxidoreductase subunit K
MNSAVYGLFWMFCMAAILLLVSGFYCILVTRNSIRVLIGIELLMKAATLIIVLVGYITGNLQVAQALVITVIIIEVVVVSVTAGVILGIFRQYNSLDTRNLRNLKG